MSADVTISCPHCQRQYTMKIDPERLKRLKTRATCGRCGNTFDAASRIVPASEATTDPKLPRIDLAPSPTSLVPKASPLPTVPDLRDEMEELAREFAEAAARFTPIAAKRPAAVLTTPPTSAAAAEPTLQMAPAPDPSPPTSDAPASAAIETAASPSPDAPLAAPPAPAPPSPTAAVEEPTRPGVKHVAVAEATAADVAAGNAVAAADRAPSAELAPPPDVAPSASDVAAAYDELSLEAPPAADDEFAASPPTQSRAPAALGWLELADRGLGALEPPPSPGAAALEALLGESETLALPPTPAAS